MTDEQRMKSSDDLLLSYLQRLIKTNPITLMWVRENECTGAGYVLIDGPNGVFERSYLLAMPYGVVDVLK